MDWKDLTRDEKRAIIKSAIQIANADGRINYSEKEFLLFIVMRMGGDQQLIDDANSMWKLNMIRVLRGMSNEKKGAVRSVWLKTMNRAYGGVLTGNTTVDRNSPEGCEVYKLGKECGIDVSGTYFVGDF